MNASCLSNTRHSLWFCDQRKEGETSEIARTDIIIWGQFPSLAMTFRRSIVSLLPTMSSKMWGRYFSTLLDISQSLKHSTEDVPRKFVRNFSCFATAHSSCKEKREALWRCTSASSHELWQFDFGWTASSMLSRSRFSRLVFASSNCCPCSGEWCGRHKQQEKADSS
jgi:hypothetical protein